MTQFNWNCCVVFPGFTTTESVHCWPGYCSSSSFASCCCAIVFPTPKSSLHPMDGLVIVSVDTVLQRAAPKETTNKIMFPDLNWADMETREECQETNKCGGGYSQSIQSRLLLLPLGQKPGWAVDGWRLLLSQSRTDSDDLIFCNRMVAVVVNELKILNKDTLSKIASFNPNSRVVHSWLIASSSVLASRHHRKRSRHIFISLFSG